MLDELFLSLCEVAPVCGLDHETLRVDYCSEPTAEEAKAVDELIEAWPLREAQIEKENEINSVVTEIEKEGYDTGKGYKISLSAKGAADLTGAVVLAKEAVDRGYEGDHYVLDSEGLTQSVTYDELIEMGLGYGTARNALYIVASQRTREVRGARTVSEVRSLNTEMHV